MDIYDYNDFIKYIKEGLITTHNYNKYSLSILSNLKGLGIHCEIKPIDNYKFRLIIYNLVSSTQKDLLSIINNYGYYPSFYKVILNNDMEKSVKFDLNEFMVDTILDIKVVEIIFESKYDDDDYSNDINLPPKLYHITKSNLLNKILKYGLIPKSKNRLSTHPDRIHFIYNIEESLKLINKFKFSDKYNNVESDYIILEIFTSDLDIRLHTDPNMISSGCFTYDNIPSKNIKLYEQQ